LLRCPVEMRRDFRSRCLPMTDGRQAYVAPGLKSLREEPKVDTAPAEATRFCGNDLLAEATSYEDFRMPSPTPVLPLLKLIVPPCQPRPTENDSLRCCEPAR
jgi:hypothetical protein